MADLGQLMGTLLVSLARARQIADTETAAIAEWYRSHPLLEGLSVPRVRVPEMTLEVPMLIEREDPGEPNQLADDATIVNAAKAELIDSAKRAGVDVSRDVSERFGTQLLQLLGEVRRPFSSDVTRTVPPEAISQAAQSAAAAFLSSSDAGPALTGDRLRQVLADIRRRVANTAVLSMGRPPSIQATLMTSEVKEKASPESVTRLRLTLREEGLEWSVVQKGDGTTTRSLSPE